MNLCILETDEKERDLQVIASVEQKSEGTSKGTS